MSRWQWWWAILVGAGFAIGFTVGQARAEIVCAPCTGWSDDVALDNDFIGVCVPGGHAIATGIEFEASYEDGQVEVFDGGTDCRVLVPLFERNRVQIRARFYDSRPRGEWGLPGARAHKLVPIEDQCVGDLDFSGAVDGEDFVLFREAYMDGCE